MATHSSILAWKTSWTEEPGRLLQRIGHDWATAHTHKVTVVFTFLTDWEKNQKDNNISWHMKILQNLDFSVHK